MRLTEPELKNTMVIGRPKLRPMATGVAGAIFTGPMEFTFALAMGASLTTAIILSVVFMVFMLVFFYYMDKKFSQCRPENRPLDDSKYEL